MKKQRGITLIALVITIIVLLILAGITISLTIGERGIITKAQEAGKNYINEQDKELADLDELTNEMDNIINTEEMYIEKIKIELAKAITQKGVPTNQNDSFNTMLNNLQKVKDCIVQEGQTSTITLGPGASTNVSINFTNINDRIPLVYVYQKQTVSGKFAFYYTQPVVTTETASFSIWNGSGTSGGSAIGGWTAIYFGDEKEDKTFVINNIEELKKELSQIITEKGVQTPEDITIEEMIENIKKIKTYEMEQGEVAVNNVKPKTGAMTTINFQKEYENPPMVIFEEKSKVGSWTVFHAISASSNTSLSSNKFNLSTSVTGSAVFDWKAITVHD